MFHDQAFREIEQMVPEFTMTTCISPKCGGSGYSSGENETKKSITVGVLEMACIELVFSSLRKDWELTREQGYKVSIIQVA
jgi:hypothetical protein